ncbi:retrotransposable element ORF2 protein [Plecturocebus cupreus]
MEYYAAIKNNEFVSFVGTWMNLETIILSKLTQEQKIKHRMFSLIVTFLGKKTLAFHFLFPPVVGWSVDKSDRESASAVLRTVPGHARVTKRKAPGPWMTLSNWVRAGDCSECISISGLSYEREINFCMWLMPVIPALFETEAGRSLGQEIETILANMMKTVSTKNTKLAGCGGTCL